MTDFEYDILDKKRLARMAKYRKSGSKSKRCSLSTDRMTRRQWEEKNGTVMTYPMNKPMEWVVFKNAPTNIQEEYIAHLYETYGATLTAIAQMFGVRSSTVCKQIKTGNFKTPFRPGARMSATQKEQWAQFLSANTPSDHIPSGEQNEGSSAAAEEPDFDSTSGGMTMTKFTLSFSGKIDGNMIANSIIGIIGQNATGTVEITCSIQDNH